MVGSIKMAKLHCVVWCSRGSVIGSHLFCGLLFFSLDYTLIWSGHRPSVAVIAVKLNDKFHVIILFKQHRKSDRLLRASADKIAFAHILFIRNSHITLEIINTNFEKIVSYTRFLLSSENCLIKRPFIIPFKSINIGNFACANVIDKIFRQITL